MLHRYIRVKPQHPQGNFVINVDTLPQWEQVNPHLTNPPQAITLISGLELSETLTNTLVLFMYYGTIINGVAFPNSIIKWYYEEHRTPLMNSLRDFRKHHKGKTLANFNKYLINKVYQHNNITDEHRQAILGLLQRHTPTNKYVTTDYDYNPHLDDVKEYYKLGLIETTPQDNTKEQEQILYYAKAFNIEIGNVYVIEHTAKKYTNFDTGYYFNYTTYEYTPEYNNYSYQGKKPAEQPTHYKFTSNTLLNATDLKNAKIEIDYILSLPQDLQKEFLNVNYDFCPHCGTPYNIYNGCLCGKIQPKETPLHLEYLPNYDYKKESF